MEWIFREQTVKLVGPGLSSTSPERRRKARRKKLTAVQSAECAGE